MAVKNSGLAHLRQTKLHAIATDATDAQCAGADAVLSFLGRHLSSHAEVAPHPAIVIMRVPDWQPEDSMAIDDDACGEPAATFDFPHRRHRTPPVIVRPSTVLEFRRRGLGSQDGHLVDMPTWDHLLLVMYAIGMPRPFTVFNRKTKEEYAVFINVDTHVYRTQLLQTLVRPGCDVSQPTIADYGFYRSMASVFHPSGGVLGDVTNLGPSEFNEMATLRVISGRLPPTPADFRDHMESLYDAVGAIPVLVWYLMGRVCYARTVYDKYLARLPGTPFRVPDGSVEERRIVFGNGTGIVHTYRNSSRVAEVLRYLGGCKTVRSPSAVLEIVSRSRNREPYLAHVVGSNWGRL